MAKSVKWDLKSPTLSILNLDVIVVQVVARGVDGETWIATSSHGQPTGEHPSRESAQIYAEKFAAQMIEKTLAQLSELEANYESPTHGWKSRICGLVGITVPPTPDFLDADGTVKPDVFEQKRSAAIGQMRQKLRKTLADLGR